MFSFLKFLNAKSDADKNKVPDNLSGTTLNLNSPEASALNIFHNKLPIAHKSNEINSPLRYVQCYITSIWVYNNFYQLVPFEDFIKNIFMVQEMQFYRY
jgi:hypothetical protein